MGQTTTGELSAGEATRVLDELSGYEETVSAKMMGITWMIWGIAIPGIFLTYGTGAFWADQVGASWLLAVFWIPWVAAATLATRSLWRSLALAFSWAEEDRSTLASLAYTALFFVLAGGLWVTGLVGEINMLMLATTGLFTMMLGLLEPVNGGRLEKPTLLVGGLLVILAVALDLTWAGTLSGADHAASSLVAALAVGSAYYGLGTFHLVRG